MEPRQQLAQWLSESQNMVFFGGAGVSTESGIPDFRSVDGLYQQKYPYPPEEIISHHFFVAHPEEFYRFYRDKMLWLHAEPNPAHRYLALLEKQGKLRSVITQNIDGLHQLAGSCSVRELHGSVHRNYCMSCGKFYDASFIAASQGVPTCSCGGIVKPDVVLYEECLDDQVLRQAMADLAAADLLIVGGTSLVVYPAAGLIDYFQGKHLVLINKSATAQDSRADLLIQEPIGAFFASLAAASGMRLGF